MNNDETRILFIHQNERLVFHGSAIVGHETQALDSLNAPSWRPTDLDHFRQLAGRAIEMQDALKELLEAFEGLIKDGVLAERKVYEEMLDKCHKALRTSLHTNDGEWDQLRIANFKGA